jgi:flagellar basal-body rod protein FlgB
MMNTSLPLFTVLSQKMSWLSARQNVLSQNVANADTPNYQARDVKAPDFQKIMDDASMDVSTMRTTNARHIAMPMSESASFQETTAEGEEGSPTGNAVSLEQEMIKLSDTQVQYQAATSIYSKTMSMFRTALGGGSQ